jgi:hypothetical protein
LFDVDLVGVDGLRTLSTALFLLLDDLLLDKGATGVLLDNNVFEVDSLNLGDLRSLPAPADTSTGAALVPAGFVGVTVASGKMLFEML